LAVKLRLKRFGRLNHPTYRLCAADTRSPRDGRIIESLGYYLPMHKREGEQVSVNAERVKYWLSVGAQPTDTARMMIKRAGISLPVPKSRERAKTKVKGKPYYPKKRQRNKKPKPKAAAAGAADSGQPQSGS
jgi:small subunit ribosomal protein S16